MFFFFFALMNEFSVKIPKHLAIKTICQDGLKRKTLFGSLCVSANKQKKPKK